MKIVTALTYQKRNKERVNVFLDGEFAFGLALTAAMSLKVGQSLLPEQISELEQIDEYERAKNLAMNLIAYRPRSISEVERRLTQKGYDEEVISQVTRRLQELELLDDEAFARYWVDQRVTFKPRGQMALRQELARKGVNRSTVDEVLADLDETMLARRAANKQVSRWEGLPRNEFRTKLGGYLQRRGFGYGTINEITNELWQSVVEEGNTDDGAAN